MLLLVHSVIQELGIFAINFVFVHILYILRAAGQAAMASVIPTMGAPCCTVHTLNSLSIARSCGRAVLLTNAVTGPQLIELPTARSPSDTARGRAPLAVEPNNDEASPGEDSHFCVNIVAHHDTVEDRSSQEGRAATAGAQAELHYQQEKEERDLARRHRAEKKSARRVIDEVLSRRPMWLTM